MSKKSEKSSKRKGSLDLKSLLKGKKEENPYRSFSRDPRPSDLKFENWQKNAKKNLQLYPDDPKKACYLGITLSTSSAFKHRSDTNYDTNHHSFLGAISNALLCNCIPPDLSDKSTEEFRQHLMSQYAHDDPENQFQYAWGTAMKSTQEDLWKNLETDSDEKESVKKERYDRELLDRYDRTEIEEFSKISPVNQKELKDIDPLDFIQQVFPHHVRNYAHGNAKKAKSGYVCVQEVVKMFGVIFDPDTDHPKNPHTGDFYEDLGDMRFMSRSIFKEASTEGGKRNKDNVAKEHLVVAEADFKLPNGDTDIERMEKFNTVMMIAKKYLPLVYVLYSGGKSYHFGFAKNDVSKEDYAEILKDLIQHGADKSVIQDPTKLVRMPNVDPEPGKDREFQELLYFDPEQVDQVKSRPWDVIGFHEEINEKKKLNIWHKDTAFYIEDANKRWVKTGSIEDFLAKQGFSKDCMIGERLSPAKEMKLNVEHNRSVDEVVNRLGGYDSGIVEFAGARILIRSNRVMPPIAEKAGSVENTLNFFKELFQSDLQFHIAMGWLADSFTNYFNNGGRSAKITPSQMMHIVGEANSGKTSFNNLVMKPLFGGSVANGAGLFVEKENHFNASEQAAAILSLDDDANLGTTERARNYQSEVVKSLTVGSTQVLHSKGVDKIDVITYKRIIRYMNFGAIPSLPLINDPSVGDKIILLKAHSNHNRSRDWYEQTEKLLKKELPYFTYYLLHEYECPEEYQPPKEQRRFPVISYHHPEIVAQLNEGSKTEQLQELINQGNLEANIERDGVSVYEGTSSQIYNELRSNLRGDELDRFKKMFSSPDKLLQALRELRVIGKNEGGQKVFYSAKDGIKPEFINDGHRYWRVLVGEKVEKQTTLEKKFFGKVKTQSNKKTLETKRVKKKKFVFGSKSSNKKVTETKSVEKKKFVFGNKSSNKKTLETKRVEKKKFVFGNK